jgi:hypothetical protein
LWASATGTQTDADRAEVGQLVGLLDLLAKHEEPEAR